MKKNIVFAIMAMIIALTGIARAQEEVPEKEGDIEIVIDGSKTKERLIDAFVEMVELSKEEIKKGGRFAKQQIPLVLEEVILLARIRSAIIFTVCVIMTIVMYKTGGKLKTYALEQDKAEDPDWSSDDIGLFFFTGMTMRYVVPIMALIILLVNIGSLLTPWIAPRVYIMEYVAELIKSI